MKREPVQAAALELCCFCSEADPGARLVLFNAHTVAGCRKQDTAQGRKLVLAPLGQFRSVEAHLRQGSKGPRQAPRPSLT